MRAALYVDMHVRAAFIISRHVGRQAGQSHNPRLCPKLGRTGFSPKTLYLCRFSIVNPDFAFIVVRERCIYVTVNEKRDHSAQKLNF